MTKRMLLIPCLAVAAVAAAWLLAPRLHRFAYWIDRKTPAEIDALATDGWRVDRLEVAPGVTLVGLLRPPRSPTARWILFAPGNSTALLAGFRSELDRLRGDADVGLAFWAYRGFEASDGAPAPQALADDLLRQWDRLRGLGAAADQIEVWGYSLGAPLALQLAARLGERGQVPRRLVLAAAAPRIVVMRHGPFGRFLPGDVYDATAALGHLPCPTVVVHGAADDALPIAGARELAQAIGARAVLHEVPGKGHLDLWDDLRRLAF